ncbi:MAG: cytochrome c biogenesis protein CcsA [Bacteroidetes bacterium]|nr:cytochrome c biogenesis protein CcsA [Bacteroidota bacterium]
MIGTVVVWVTFAAFIGSAFFYYRSTSAAKYEGLGRQLFWLGSAGVAVASALLMTYILQHRFEYHYIWGYSSRDLPLSLLVTTFWAGQEGSFLLWALFATLVGIFLQRYASRKQTEHEVMAIYAAVMSVLLILLSAKSPFEYIWQVDAEVPVGLIPQDGRGLNPLLQNFWMIIHPPVLFVGFAALAVPFTMAIAALWQKRYSDWIRQAFPWVLFGGVSLGAGLILGGYWAYGVLGWGGWWGWDPVENSSLIPWIVSIILIHTMLIQLLTGRLARMNFVLAIAAFLLVVYSTFLTRSGVLAEASVHSFVDPGMYAYTLLVLWLVGSAVLGFGMVWRRRGDLKTTAPTSDWMTRESMLSIASLVMGVSALVILFGTSWPLLSKILPFGKASVEPSFYDKTNLPLAVLMTILLGFSLKVKWNESSAAGFIQRLAVPLGIAVVLTVVLGILGVTDIAALALCFSAAFAMVVSVEHGFRLVRQQPSLVGGALAHAGLAMLLLGVIASGRYGEKQAASLPMNQPKEVLGYTVTYLGAKQRDDGKWEFLVQAEKDGGTTVLAPVMYESTYNNSLMRNPDYASFLTRDFYIEPVSLEEGTSSHAGEGQQVVELVKGEPMTIGPMQVTFVGFEMNAHGGQMGAMGQMTIGAKLEIVTEKKKQTLVPTSVFGAEGPTEVRTANLPGSNMGFQLVAVNAAQGGGKSMVQMNIVGLHGIPSQTQTPPTLIAEVSVKPFMTFVWAAAVLILGGLAVAMVRRLRLSNA